MPPRTERHGRAAGAPVRQRDHLEEGETPREREAVAVHLVQVDDVAGMLLERGPRRRGLVEPRSGRSVATDAREVAVTLASFMAPGNGRRGPPVGAPLHA
ncbi:hypothetical protein BE17_17775 [Sorangium cellulosum]|uniref:Uncharacterized protein n=1 Tax=Sorangium cellulosum TaxID=56 RepID=A0A150RTC0_SORCE|nr:hypothetical protein BE17_17775 [Sorangium cellulosum]